MTALTDNEKALLRAGGHKVKLYLSISKPSTLLSAVVTGTPSRGDRNIGYGSGTGSGYAKIAAGQPLWVGTGAGAKDKGVVRIRAITGNQTSGTFTLAENSVDWAAGDNLTVLFDYPLWPVYPWMGGDPVVWKKDGPDGDEYVDQNTLPPPVAIAGPHRAGWLTGSPAGLAIYLDAGQSYNVNARSPASYLWACDGGSIDSNSSAATHIDFDTAGQYWLDLVVTDDAPGGGKTQITHRRLFVHDANNLPYTAFSLDSLSGDWERGGWSARFTVRGAASAADFPDGALVLLWQDATYGSTAQNIGGYKYNLADARNVLFAGYIRGESVSADWNTGEVSFEATTIEGLLRRHQMFSISLQHITGTQDQWWEYLSPTVAQAVHHLWRWHSTLFQVADVFLPTSNSFKAKAFDFERGNLYSMADTGARNKGIFAHVVSTKYGVLHLETDIQVLSAETVIMDITKSDRRAPLDIRRQIENQVGMVNLSGIAFDGAAATALVSVAPGDAPADVGAETLDIEGQVLSTQALTNALAGRLLAAANNPYPNVAIPMKGHYLGAFDLAPQEWATLSLAAGDTSRGIVWSGKNLVARNVSADFDPKAGSILTDIVFEAEAEGADGVTGDYPTTPPDDAPDPDTPNQPPAIVNPPVGALSAYSTANGHFWRPAAGGSFAARNGGLSGASIQDTAGRYDPFWHTPAKQNTSDPEKAILWKCDVGHIYRSPDAGLTWQDRTPITDPPNSWSDATAPTAGTVTYSRLASSTVTDKLHFVLAEYQGDASAWRGWVARTADDGLTWTWYPISPILGPTDTHPSQYVYSEVSYSPGSQAGGYWATLTDRANAIGSTEGNYSRLEGNQDGDGQTPITWILDLGGTATGVTRINVKMVAGTGSGAWRFYCYTSTNGTDWTQQGTYMTVYNYHTETAYIDFASTSTRYLKFEIYEANNPFHYTLYCNLDTIYVTNTGFTSSLGAITALRPLWADVDSSNLWLTTWVTDGTNPQLLLLKLALADCSTVTQVALGACTLTELNNATYAAYVFAGAATTYIFGKVAAVPGLSGAQLVAKSSDGGVTWTSVVDATAWATGICGAFADLSGEYIAVRNDATNKFYKGTGVLTYVSDTAFGTNPGALTVSATGNIAIGSNAGPNVRVSADNGATWSDVSTGITAGGAISALTYV